MRKIKCVQPAQSVTCNAYAEFSALCPGHEPPHTHSCVPRCTPFGSARAHERITSTLEHILVLA
eukprot:270285-Pelagomonas_calceolata.AAC.1